jgi:hypothetical protein
MLVKIADTERLEGLVSNAATVPIRLAGRTHWVKVKNGQHPAMSRVRETFG